ncbi:hypothetical protein [Leptospira andrefontaineae]|nr:hypothetical protein [Leptospira andrefontaineae]
MEEEKIPPGFPPESWKLLTPEQKQQYLDAYANVPSADGSNSRSSGIPSQGQIYAQAGKQMLLGYLWSFLRNLIYRLLRF